MEFRSSYENTYGRSGFVGLRSLNHYLSDCFREAIAFLQKSVISEISPLHDGCLPLGGLLSPSVAPRAAGDHVSVDRLRGHQHFQLNEDERRSPTTTELLGERASAVPIARGGSALT